MSYCRFSSSNWRSDVYVYEHCGGGWTTHVAASKRLIGPIPALSLKRFPSFGGQYDKATRTMLYPSRWHELAAGIGFGFWTFWHNRLHMASLHLIPLRPIGERHDGETFSDATPGDCADRLEYLRGQGYFVPQHAINALRAEEADGVTS